MAETGFRNPSDEEIRALLERVRSIAMVGLSDREDRASHGVAKALKEFGYRVVPVNPTVDSVLGENAVAGLSALEGPVDLVDVFRAPRHVSAIVDECIELGLPALWLQEGVVDEEAALRAVSAGVTVIMDRCIYKEYTRLIRRQSGT